MSSEAVRLSDGIVGILTTPDQTAPARAVLMLHGFASHKDEVGGLYRRLAATLREVGIASLRIDFRGWGESALLDSSVQTMLDDATTALDYLRGQAFIDSQRLGIVGFSLGGAVAILLAAQQTLRSLVLWSPVGDLRESLTLLRQRARSNGDTLDLDLGWRQVQLKESFFESSFNLQQVAEAVEASTFLLYGEVDPLSKHLVSYLSSLGTTDKEGMILPQADHIFQALEPDQQLAALVIEKTSGWFQRTL